MPRPVQPNHTEASTATIGFEVGIGNEHAAKFSWPQTGSGLIHQLARDRDINATKR
jgi:hypothetical protein